jgi:GTPase Era involved in 16S rRNA processing
MFEKLRFDIKKVYPTLVISTMSSGKSTLINALVGTELLPNRHQACTARAVAIMDNDMKPEFEIHAVDSKGVYSFIEHATLDVVSDFNSSNDVSEMIIEGDIKGIKNSKKALLLIDTPGINNSLDLSHEVVTKKVIDEYPEGLLLYVINAQQIGTYDDSAFLDWVVRKLKGNDKFDILFAINKMDLVDYEKENPRELVENCRNYIKGKGIENPIIIPISAGNALTFKKALAGVPLSELEEEDFSRNYKYFKRDGYSLQDYVSEPGMGELDKKVVIDGIEYTYAQIYAALENTGLPFLERKMDEMLVKSLKMTSPKISAECTKMANAYEDVENKNTTPSKKVSSKSTRYTKNKNVHGNVGNIKQGKINSSNSSGKHTKNNNGVNKKINRGKNKR